jgi:hypothetical protein
LETGKIKRSNNKYKLRYEYLNRERIKNNSRIIRIIKSLGDMGFENYKKPLIEHFVNEVYVDKILIDLTDFLTQWISYLNDDDQKIILENIEKIKKNTKLVDNKQNVENIKKKKKFFFF